MDTIRQSLTEVTAQLVALLPQLVVATLFFLVTATVGFIFAGAVARLVRPGKSAGRYVKLVSRAIQAVFLLVGLVLALQVLGLTAVATSLLATGGLMAVVLGFAFREIGENLLAGIFLGLSRSFDVGDLIESSGYVGKVRGMDLRQVWIRSADGRDIFIPSAQIFRNVLLNYTRDDLRRADFVVGLDYADPVWEAREVLQAETERVHDVLRPRAVGTHLGVHSAVL